MKTVFVNPERCIGCRQCEFACAVEHSTSHDPVAAIFEHPAPRTRIHAAPGPTQSTSFPVKCRHCDPAPCEQVCPTGAIYRNGEYALVLIDPRKCIACAMCAMVCPFDALTFHPDAHGMPENVVALKCDGCVDRLRESKEPACAETCKVDALMFGDLNELINEGRVREAAAVLSASTALEPVTPSCPDNVKAWRDWGCSTSVVKV